MQIVLWRDFTGVIKVLPTLTSWQGDDLGGPDIISWVLDWKSEKAWSSITSWLWSWRDHMGRNVNDVEKLRVIPSWQPAETWSITPVATRNGIVPTTWVTLKADSSSQSSQTRVPLGWHLDFGIENPGEPTPTSAPQNSMIINESCFKALFVEIHCWFSDKKQTHADSEKSKQN